MRHVLHYFGNVQGLTTSATSALAPKDAKRAFERGTKALDSNKPDEAQKELQKAVDLYPRYAEAWSEIPAEANGVTALLRTALLESWRPQIAIISCGRGNTFGHPAPEVLERLESIGARVYRTDRDGEITLSSDGRSVEVRTFTGEKE